MTLKKFLENLQELVNKHPEALEYEVIYAKDDEGNGFQEIHFEPSLGIFEEDEFISKANIEDYEREEKDINAICIN